VVGADPADGVVITAQNGRYGPYITKDKDSRSLASEEAIFDITLDEALTLLAQPKQRRGQAAAKPAIIVGVDPSTGKEIQLKEGRFGPYVTDGETNASLRRADDPATISLERAADLLAERRANPPAKKTARKAPAKKAAAKKAPAKKTAAKKTAAPK
jgi:DNA topoisomerase-1